MPERVVRPGILTSDAINLLSWQEEIFYRRLMSVVDDYGRFDGRDSVLRANLYPLRLDHVSDSDVRKWKTACSEAGVVRLYFVDEKPFIEVLKFDQRMRGKPKWPAPIDGDLTATRGDPPQPAASCAKIRLSSESESESNTESNARVDAHARAFGIDKDHPTLEEAIAEAKSKGFTCDVARWFHVTTAAGWVDSTGRPIRNWRAALAGWNCLEPKMAHGNGHKPPVDKEREKQRKQEEQEYNRQKAEEARAMGRPKVEMPA